MPDISFTLSEFGKRLPIGYEASGKLHRDFTLRDCDWDLEERIGEDLEAEPADIAAHVSIVVSNSLKSVGDVDFDKMSPELRRNAVSSMYMDDVFSVYLWTRIDLMGPQLKLNDLKCGGCRKDIDFVGDLRDVEVYDSRGEVPQKTVELEGGITYAGELRSSLVVRPVRWSFFESGGITLNPAKQKLLAIQHGVVEVVGAPKPAMMTRDHVRAMKPRDVKRVVNEINECGGGAVLQIEGKCPECSKGFRHDIDWRYGDFFGPSVP